MYYHSTGLLNWQTKATRMVGSGTGIQVKTSFDELIYPTIKGIHPKRFYETGGLYFRIYDHSEQGNATNTRMPD